MSARFVWWLLARAAFPVPGEELVHGHAGGGARAVRGRRATASVAVGADGGLHKFDAARAEAEEEPEAEEGSQEAPLLIRRSRHIEAADDAVAAAAAAAAASAVDSAMGEDGDIDLGLGHGHGSSHAAAHGKAVLAESQDAAAQNDAAAQKSAIDQQEVAAAIQGKAVLADGHDAAAQNDAAAQKSELAQQEVVAAIEAKAAQKQKNLALLEAEVLDILRASETPEMKGYLKDIEEKVTTGMIPAVMAAHQKDQLEIDRLGSSVEACSASTPEYWERVSAAANASKDHKHCRQQQELRFEIWRACLANQSNGSVCKWVNDLTRANASRCSRKPENETYLAYLERLDREFDDRLEELRDRKQRCLLLASQDNDTCQPYENAYNNKSHECDNKQWQLEHAYCLLVSTRRYVCSAYMLCRNVTLANFDSQKGRFEANEKDRKAEWHLLKQIHCLTDSAKDNSSGYLGKTVNPTCPQVNTSHLDLRWPSNPPDYCVANEQPCNDGYIEKQEYAKLPPNAQAAKCRPCENATTTGAPAGGPTTAATS